MGKLENNTVMWRPTDTSYALATLNKSALYPISVSTIHYTSHTKMLCLCPWCCDSLCPRALFLYTFHWAPVAHGWCPPFSISPQHDRAQQVHATKPLSIRQRANGACGTPATHTHTHAPTHTQTHIVITLWDICQCKGFGKGLECMLPEAEAKPSPSPPPSWSSLPHYFPSSLSVIEQLQHS